MNSQKTGTNYLENASVDEIDLFQFFSNLVKFKKLIIISAIVGSVIGGLLSLFPTPKYSATSILTPTEYSSMISPGSGGLGGVSGIGSLIGLNLGSESNVSETMETLQSFQFLSAFIGENDLMPVLFPKNDGIFGKIKFLLKGTDEVTLWEAHKFFNKEVMSLNFDRTSKILTLSITWTNPEVATSWANQLVERLNMHQQRKELVRLKRNSDYLSKKLEVVKSQDLQLALVEILKAQIQQSMLAAGHDDFVLKVIDPAHVAPLDQYVFPNHILFVVLGFIIGIGVSCIWVIRIIMKERN